MHQKPFYKRVWFWVIVIIVFSVIGALNKDEEVGDNNVQVTSISNDNAGKGEPTEVDTDLAATAKANDVAETSTRQIGSNAVMSAVEPDKELQVISDIFEVVRKDEKTVDKWFGAPSSREEGDFRLAGTETKVPAVTSYYKDNQYEIVFIDGVAQRITYTPSEIIGWEYNEEHLHDFLYSMGLGELEPVQDTDTVKVYKHPDLYDLRIFNNSGKISYLYIIADEKYQ
jgi:hypothetical protein